MKIFCCQSSEKSEMKFDHEISEYLKFLPNSNKIIFPTLPFRISRII